MIKPMTELDTRRGWLVVLLAIALLFAVIAPTLSRVEFGRTLENLNIATSLEARRDGHWFIPTLEGQPRTKKPPLTAWITAFSMSPATVRDCSSPDASVRRAAFARLAYEARLPALLMACATLLAVYFLGKMIGGATIGATAALIAGSSYLFIRYAQVSLTDVPLAFFVITANAFIAAAIFDRRIWLGPVGAGVAIGLAFMSKGPVAFVQTLLPLLAWLTWKVWRERPRRPSMVPSPSEPSFPLSYESLPVLASAVVSVKPRASARVLPILIGACACLLVALPWYIAVLLKDPSGQWNTWFKEVTGTDAPERADPRFIYLLFMIVMIFPWIAFWLGGLWLALQDAVGNSRRPLPSRQPERADRYVFLLSLVIVPIVVMTFFKDKKERYMLPMIGPAAVMTARCVIAYFAERHSAKRDWVGWLHWGTLAVVAIGLPALGASGAVKALRTVEGRPWYSPRYAGMVLGIGVALLAVGGWAHASRPRAMALVTFLLMLLIGSVFTHGYRETSNGRSTMRPLAERIWAKYSDAELYNALPVGERSSVDLSIYLNRTTGWIPTEQLANPVAGSRPKVILMRRADANTAGMLSDRWEFLGDAGEWRAMVLERGGR